MNFSSSAIATALILGATGFAQAHADAKFSCLAAETAAIHETIQFTVQGSGKQAQITSYVDDSDLQTVTAALLVYITDVSPNLGFEGTMTFVNKDGSLGATGAGAVVFSEDVLDGNAGVLLSMRGEDPLTYRCERAN